MSMYTKHFPTIVLMLSTQTLIFGGCATSVCKQTLSLAVCRSVYTCWQNKDAISTEDAKFQLKNYSPFPNAVRFTKKVSILQILQEQGEKSCYFLPPINISLDINFEDTEQIQSG